MSDKIVRPKAFKYLFKRRPCILIDCTICGRCYNLTKKQWKLNMFSKVQVFYLRQLIIDNLEKTMALVDSISFYVSMRIYSKLNT